MSTRRLPALLLLLLTATLVIAGCGGDDSGDTSASVPAATTPDTSGDGGSSTVEIDVADSGLAYAATSAEASAGTVTITSTNPQSIEHNIAIRSEDGSVDEQGELVADGGVSEVSVDLEPGTYTFYCSVPGHEDGGMSGTLTVT